MKKSRRKFSAKFKTKVVLEALNERSTIQQLASKYELHANQISIWKTQFLKSADRIFDDNLKPISEEVEQKESKLYKKIGQLQVEVDFLKKSLGES